MAKLQARKFNFHHLCLKHGNQLKISGATLFYTNDHSLCLARISLIHIVSNTQVGSKDLHFFPDNITMLLQVWRKCGQNLGPTNERNFAHLSENY